MLFAWQTRFLWCFLLLELWAKWIFEKNSEKFSPEIGLIEKPMVPSESAPQELSNVNRGLAVTPRDDIIDGHPPYWR
jgi:hypothetical protein